MVGQCFLFRPVLNVGAVDQLILRITLAETVVDAGTVGGIVEVILRYNVIVGVFLSRCQNAAVGCGSGDGAGIHQGNGTQLADTGLRTLAVREVAGRVADA